MIGACSQASMLLWLQAKLANSVAALLGDAWFPLGILARCNMSWVVDGHES
jgi:hypothetical protein